MRQGTALKTLYIVCSAPPLVWMKTKPGGYEAMNLYVKIKLAIEFDSPERVEEFKYWIQTLNPDTVVVKRELPMPCGAWIGSFPRCQSQHCRGGLL